MKLFGLYVGSASNVVTREAYDAMQASYGRALKSFESADNNLRVTRTTLEQKQTELNNALNRLEASQTREADLNEQLRLRDVKVEELSQTQIGDQQDRLAHNELLLVVGKAWLNFKNAWQFRKDNPNMNPKVRAANNETLDHTIAEVDRTLPKKVEQVSRQADPAPSHEPAKSGRVKV